MEEEMENRPRARKKTVTGSGSVHKRGSGEGGKPVGGGHGFSGSGKGFGKNVLGGGSGSSGSGQMQGLISQIIGWWKKH